MPQSTPFSVTPWILVEYWRRFIASFGQLFWVSDLGLGRGASSSSIMKRWRFPAIWSLPESYR